MSSMRLQRFLALSGIASRRKAEEFILAGRVTVNGRAVRELGTKVDTTKDVIAVDGVKTKPEAKTWILLHKPPGCVSTTSDPEGRETVLDLLGKQHARLYPVGRLDYNSSGVLLLTNDGQLAEALLHPRNQIRRVYHVKLKGIVDPDDLARFAKGVRLDDGKIARAETTVLTTTGTHTWVEMVLHQGINHQIHRMAQTIGRWVLKLIRVEFAGIRADDLPPAKWRFLTDDEINRLQKVVNRQETTAKPASKRMRPQRSAKPRMTSTKHSASPRNAKSTTNKTEIKKHPPQKQTAKPRPQKRAPFPSNRKPRRNASAKPTQRKKT